MEQSLFSQWVDKYFKGVVIKVTEKTNDAKDNIALPYLHKRLLRPSFSVTGKWETLSGAYNRVAADVVAMDSSLPLKARDSISKASGDIPKMGMELALNERQLTDLNTLVKSGASDKVILQRLFEDTPKAIVGINERIEAMFLQGLSTGVTLVNNANNVGTGVRLDFGYLTANKFGVTTLWSNTASTPFDDIQRVINKATADGNIISRVLLDSATLNNIAKTTQAKELFAFNIGFVGSNTPVPSLEQLNQLTSSRYGFVFEKVDRTIKIEKDGVRTNVKPWAVGAVAFVCSDNIGNIEWAELAEMAFPVAGVSYETADQFILVSKYRRNTPSLSEYTSSQARVAPVISGVEEIYLLDSTTIQV